ncbi:MAG: hypothetical protein CISAcid_15010 [uncultured Acidilobus sp. CIS]|jgi:hypothetical protein|nr:MAG: hypothetical protein CISAcid_15010 [uncultured Acidilobus sp. CIS]ESQ22301.1 MAG: hypothetical protein MGAcid_16130 [uncultured Acidilobus sp. MG]ESQ26915.1 MAG: hypothetical protein OSP8Acid_01160 [uncultured Acidilobus sp. OSP8]
MSSASEANSGPARPVRERSRVARVQAREAASDAA